MVRRQMGLPHEDQLDHLGHMILGNGLDAAPREALRLALANDLIDECRLNFYGMRSHYCPPF
jgi:hypothetical protein